MNIDLVAIAEEDRSVLANLLQLYQYDFSEFHGHELSPHGTFTYRHLDSYFLEPGREPWFITVDGRLAGFALVRQDVDHDGSRNLGEFFVVRKYRRRGVATAAARQLFRRYPGVWTLAFEHDSPGAAAFWPALIESVAEPAMTTFSPLTAGSRVRFLVG